RIGEGGMGQVYKAYDTALQRPVALKLLKGDDPEHSSRFLREAQAQARVTHDHVCKVYEVGERGGRPYIAMQLIEGQPLFITERRNEFGAPFELGGRSGPPRPPIAERRSEFGAPFELEGRSGSPRPPIAERGNEFGAPFELGGGSGPRPSIA